MSLVGAPCHARASRDRDRGRDRDRDLEAGLARLPSIEEEPDGFAFDVDSESNAPNVVDVDVSSTLSGSVSRALSRLSRDAEWIGCRR